MTPRYAITGYLYTGKEDPLIATAEDGLAAQALLAEIL